MNIFLRLIKKLATAAAVFCLTTSITAAAEPASEPPLPGTLRIHYHRNDGNYKDFGLWLWDEVKTPSTDWPKGGTAFTGRDKDGAFADIELLENAAQVGFLILNTSTGDKEAGSKTLHVAERSEVWVTENDDNVYDSPEFKLKLELSRAEVVSSGKLMLSFNSVAGLDLPTLQQGVAIKDRSGKAVDLIAAQVIGNKIQVTAAFTADKAPLSVSFAGKTLWASLDWRLIDQLYGCDDTELGCRLSGNQAVFKLWAPLASQARVLVFAGSDQTKMLKQIDMQRGHQGLWQASITEGENPEIDKLEGCFYQYEVTNPGQPAKRVLDPYARSMAPVTMDAAGQSAGSSGDFVGKGAIVAPEKYGPALSHPVIDGYKKREDAVIYEVHIRDFTSDPAIEKSLNHRWGSFGAFIDKLPYIKAMGVTHIQLLPVMAWYFGDETKMGERELEYRAKNNNYNWGYDPQNYFSPDGAFSERPEDPTARLTEFKTLVNAIHEAGMGVVLDVVYTHMAKASFLNDIVPDYYFFKDVKGNFLGDFGNNLATNRKMAARLLHDSVEYWFREFKIDGMRFDMMGDATAEAIQAAFNKAAAINPQALFTGEGWRTFKGHLEDPALAGKGADQGWMDKTDSVGVFSDEFRNELKSGFGCEGDPMFLTGGARNIDRLFSNIKAQPGNTPADAPGDMVQYIEAHDNLPLYDVIAQSIKKDPEIQVNNEEIHRRIRLGNAILLTSQGTIMLHAGQEYGRSKQWLAESTPEQKFHFFTDAAGKPFKHPYFIHDSYDSSDAINKFDWARATDAAKYAVNQVTVEYTRGLIALRRSSDAFRLGNKALVDSNVCRIDAPEIKESDLLIAYSCKSSDGVTFFVFVNADSVTRAITTGIDLQKTDCLVDRDRAGIAPISVPAGISIKGSVVTLEPLIAAVFRSRP
ncbi:MAG TPA: pullulanase [Candidatus Rifleibacterium sp.]|nr:pullulanase [Candidatus Rifleibacterium sp.]HPT46123.1 pullulanase [Candidatus Rifleibacterium sp.]